MEQPNLLQLEKNKVYYYGESYDEECKSHFIRVEYIEFDGTEEREVKNPFDIDLVGCKHILFQHSYGRYGASFSVRMNPFQDDDRKRFYSRDLTRNQELVSEEEFMEKANELLDKILNDDTIEPSCFVTRDCLELLKHIGLDYESR
jgi:hypothetical protein